MKISSKALEDDVILKSLKKIAILTLKGVAFHGSAMTCCSPYGAEPERRGAKTGVAAASAERVATLT